MKAASPARYPTRASALLVGVLGLALALPATAFGGADPVAGGTTTLELTLKKVKVKKAIEPASKDGKTVVNLPNTSGSFDPVAGTGTLQNGGGFRLKKKGKKKKVKVRKIKTSFGSGGKMSAKVGKKNVKTLALVSGGTASRDDFGGQVTGATATLTKKGAKALNKAFKKKKKGKIKSGKPLGTLSTETVPQTVEVLPGGTMVLTPSTNLTTEKFLPKGVNPLNGVEAVPPGEMHENLPPEDLVTFEFPVTGGSLGLGFDDGTINTAGGLKLTKTQNAGIPPLPGPCQDKYPVGNFVEQTNLSPEFAQGAMLADVVSQAGSLATQGNSGALDFSDATTTIDHATKEVTVTGVELKLTSFPAGLLNDQIFGPSSAGCGPASSDFKDGDVLGTIEITATLR